MRILKVVVVAGVVLAAGAATSQPAAADGLPSQVVDVEFTDAESYSIPQGVVGPDPVPSVEIDEAFDMIGLLWEGGDVSELWLQVRNPEGIWGDWVRVDVDADHAPDDQSGRSGSSPVYTGPATGARFAVHGDPIGVEAMLINTQALESTGEVGGPAGLVSAGNAPVPSWPGASFVQNRSAWDSTGCRREGAETSYSSAKAIVIHHTAGSNNYTQAQVPGIIAGHCLYHVNGRGWDDIGYNFLVDKFGTVWEGRTGSKTSPVQGAHTGGFNSQTQGIAMMGNFDSVAPTDATITGLKVALNWLTGWHSIDPTGSVTLVPGTGAVGFTPGQAITSLSIVGHGDLGSTSCPGGIFYATLATVRTETVPVNFGFNPETLLCDGRAITIFGTPGNDVISGTFGSDVVHGVFGNDWIFGLGGDDFICGGSGNDVLIGGGGHDRLFGGDGADSCGGEFTSGCETIPNDEQFFYRSTDGVFKYYRLTTTGNLVGPLNSGLYSKGWDSITAVDLGGDGHDGQFFYRSTDGVFKYYSVTSGGSLVGPLNEGTYSKGWDSITAIDLDGNGHDEQFFYRSSDGVFKYYELTSIGSLIGPLNEGTYSKGWDSITAIDLDGDGQDEQFFYRSTDGVFKYYDVNPDGTLGAPLVDGVYSKGWDSITAVDLDGDGQDEQFFYRSSDGVFKYYDVTPTGSLVGPLNEGTYSKGWDSITAIDFNLVP